MDETPKIDRFALKDGRTQRLHNNKDTQLYKEVIKLLTLCIPVPLQVTHCGNWSGSCVLEGLSCTFSHLLFANLYCSRCIRHGKVKS